MHSHRAGDVLPWEVPTGQTFGYMVFHKIISPHVEQILISRTLFETSICITRELTYTSSFLSSKRACLKIPVLSQSPQSLALVSPAH